MLSARTVLVILLFLVSYLDISDSARSSSRGSRYRSRYSYYSYSSGGDVNVVGIAIGCSVGGITVIVVAIILIKHYCCSSYGGGCGGIDCPRLRCPKCTCRCKKPTFKIKSKTEVIKCEGSVKNDPFKLAHDSDEEQNYVSLETTNGDIRKPARLPPLRNNQVEPLQKTSQNEQETNEDKIKTGRVNERLPRRQTDSAINDILRRQDGGTSVDNSTMFPPPPANYIPITRQHGDPPPPTYAEAVNEPPSDK